MHFEINAGHLTPTYVSLVACTNEACIPSAKTPGVMIYPNIAPHHVESLLKLLGDKGIPYKTTVDGSWQGFNRSKLGELAICGRKKSPLYGGG